MRAVRHQGRDSLKFRDLNSSASVILVCFFWPTAVRLLGRIKQDVASLGAVCLELSRGRSLLALKASLWDKFVVIMRYGNSG